MFSNRHSALRSRKLTYGVQLAESEQEIEFVKNYTPHLKRTRFFLSAACKTHFFTIPAKENAKLEERTGDSNLLMDDLTGFVKDLLKSDKGKHRKANSKKKMTLSPKKEQESSVSSTVSTVEVHTD